MNKFIHGLIAVLLVATAVFAVDPPLSQQQMFQNAPKETAPQGSTRIVTVRGSTVRTFSLTSTAKLVPAATTTTPGTVIIGTGLAVGSDGKLNNTGIAGVASWKGRGGAVVPIYGDYSISQIKSAATVAKTGSYNDLINKPTIPSAQVNSDWNASSGDAQILNKPTIPTALSQLTQSSSYRTVTDAEKNTWNTSTASVNSVNGHTGTVTLAATDVGADPLGSATSVQGNLDTHTGNTNNPHAVTKTQLGLGSVDNTADTAKPVSTAQQTALNLKLNNTTFATYTSNDRLTKTEAAATYAPTSILAAVATSGDYSSLSGKPSLGTAAAYDVPASGNASNTQVAKGDDGRLTDARTPTAHNQDANTITTGTLAIGRIPTGTTSTTVPLGNDSRFSDSRTPTSHHSTHSTGGSDAIAPGDIGAAPATFIELVAVADSNGTHGNGTDNYSAIISALNSAASTGKPLHIPPGIFRSASPISKTLTAGQSLRIYGEGTIFVDDDTSANAFAIIGDSTSAPTSADNSKTVKSKVELSGLTITRYNTGVLRGGKLLYLQYITKFSAKGLDLSGSSGMTLGVIDSSHGEVTGNKVHDGTPTAGADGIHILENSNDISVSNNTVWATGDDCYAVGVHASGRIASNVTFSGNTGRDSAMATGFKAHSGAQHISWNGGVLQNNPAGGVSIFNDSAASDMLDINVTGVTIINPATMVGDNGGMTVSNWNQTSQVSDINLVGNTINGGRGISLFGADSSHYIKSVKVSDNKIFNASDDSLYVDYVDGLVMARNKTYGSGESGLYANYLKGTVQIDDNLIDDYSVSTDSNYGFYVNNVDSTASVYIRDNVVKSVSSGSLGDYSLSTLPSSAQVRNNFGTAGFYSGNVYYTATQVGAIPSANLVTSVGSPGTNVNVPTEEAVRTAIAASATNPVTLKTGGVNNAVQSTLNLSAGANVTLADVGNGTVTISSSGSVGTPSGSDTQVQFNDGGGFGGAGSLKWGKASSFLGLGGGSAPAYRFDLRGSGSGTSQFHMAKGDADDGAYLYAHASDSAYLTAGLSYASGWQAKTANFSAIGLNSGAFTVYSNTGQTVGAATTVLQRMKIDTDGMASFGTSNPRANVRLTAEYVNAALSDSGATQYVSGYSLLDVTNAVDNNNLLYGQQQSVITRGAANYNNQIRGISSEPTHFGTGQVWGQYGLYTNQTNSSTGTINAMYGVFTKFGQSNAGGTITNLYGVYIDNAPTTGTVTNKYGVYQADPGMKNYFAGAVSAKTFTPSLPSASTDASTVTFDLDDGDSPNLLFTSGVGTNRTLAFSNPRAGGWYSLKLKQDGTGSRTVTWPSTGLVCTFIKSDGTTTTTGPTLHTAANAVDTIVIHVTSTTAADCYAVGY